MKINEKFFKNMKDYDFKDDLSRMIENYSPSELSLDELDSVYAASSQTNQPDYSEFLKNLNNNK